MNKKKLGAKCPQKGTLAHQKVNRTCGVHKKITPRLSQFFAEDDEFSNFMFFISDVIDDGVTYHRRLSSKRILRRALKLIKEKKKPKVNGETKEESFMNKGD